jgi:hypothetical protein
VKPASATVATSIEAFGDIDARLPKDFKVQGSMDVSSWTDLTTVTGATVASSKVAASFSNSTAYTYYRLLITANQSAVICQIDELTLNNTANPSITPASYGGEIWAVIKNSTAQSRNWHGAGDTWYKFGGDPGGQWYDDFGLSGTRIAWTPAQRVDQWRLVRITHDGTAIRHYIDNALDHTQGPTSYALFDDFVQIGNGTHDIAEILVRDRVSTTAEAASLTAYFNTEHGLTVSQPDILGGTMSTSSTYGTAVPARSQDGNNGSEWMADNVIPCWLKATYGSAQTAGSYRLTSMTGQNSRAPGSWTLQGSNDGSSWTTLDTQTGVTGWLDNTPKVYTLAAPATYTQFRINVTAKQAAGDGYINIGEFWLLSGVDAPALSAYAQEVLTDSPWGFWQLAETSGFTLADSSGNARPMTIVSGSGGVTAGRSGPTAEIPAARPTGNAYGGTTATSTASTATIEFWVKVPSGTISAGNPLVHLQQNSTTYDKVVWLGTDGKIYFDTYNGAAHVTSTVAAVARDVWHHVVASIGPAGQKLRINKITEATDAATTSYTGAQAVYFGGSSGSRSGGHGFEVAGIAFYQTQLSDARTDAHYNTAGVGGGSPAIQPDAFGYPV